MAIRGEIGLFFCDICGRPIEREEMVGRCVVCGKITRRKCGGVCSKCGRTLCMHHVQIKKGVWYCSECRPRCFVVTAVGTSSDGLRHFYWFRDDFMMQNTIGQKLIDVYYLIGPYLANLIVNRKKIKRLLCWSIIKPSEKVIERMRKSRIR